MSGYIADGYTRTDGYIAEGPKSEATGEVAYAPLEFTYRPSTRLENIKVDAEISLAAKNEKDPESAVKAEKIACEFIAKKIVSWDLKAVGIHDVAVSADAMGRMHPLLFQRLYRIVRGVEFNDKKPDAETAPVSDGDQLKN